MRRAATSTVAVEMAAAAAVALGPALHSVRMPDADMPRLIAVACIGSLAMGRCPQRLSAIRIGVAITAGLILMPSAGEMVALWVMSGLILVDWTFRRRPPLAVLGPPMRDAAVAAVVFLLLAARAGRDAGAVARPLVFMAAALVTTLAGSLWSAELSSFIRRFSRGASTLVARVCFTALSVPFIVFPWAVQRVLGLDPLHALGPGGGWSPRLRRPASARRPWEHDTVPVTARPWLRTRQGIGFLVTSLAVVGLIVGLTTVVQIAARHEPTIEAPPESAGAVYAGEGGWQEELSAEWSWINQSGPGGGFSPLGPFRVRDVEGRYINVIDGVRQSWRAPACDCTRLSVWLYGGSAAFGFGQRDDHTIASSLAQQAAELGIVVDVENRGVMGDLHWQESLRFARDLQAATVLPDLVVFYDGYNDVRGAAYRALRGDPYDDTPVDLSAEQLLEAFQASMPPATAVDGSSARLRDEAEHPTVENDVIAELTIERYDAARETTSLIAESYGVPVTYVWQPTRADAGEKTDEEFGPLLLELGALPADVVDARHSLDDVADEVFLDEVHHDEVGAELVASTILQEILPTLRAAEE